jgi:periplasmic divalent cation tolerance protein
MAVLLQVQTTFASAEDARRVARELVVRRLAACCQLVPGLLSIYEWDGEVQQAEETLLLVKTTAARWPELRDKLAELHPYDTPEIIATQVEHASFDYMAWVRDSVE